MGGLGRREARAVRMERPSSPAPRTRMDGGSMMLWCSRLEVGFPGTGRIRGGVTERYKKGKVAF